MSSLNLPSGAENLSKVPVLSDNLALGVLKQGASDKVKAGLDKIINSNRTFFDKAIEFLTDEKNLVAMAMVETNGGYTLDLVEKVAAQIKQQSIKDDQEERFRQAGKEALKRAKKGSVGDGLGE